MAKRILINVVPELKNLVNEIKGNVKAGVESVHETLGDAGLAADTSDAGIARALATDVLAKVFSNADVRTAVEKVTAQLLADAEYIASIVPVVDAEEEISEEAEAEEVEEDEAVVA